MLRAVRSFTVLSFMSEWGGNSHHKRNASSAQTSPTPASPSAKQPHSFASPTDYNSPGPVTRPRQDSQPSSRPMSMIQTYQPPVMEVSQDTLPELQRIFTFLNSHSNKLYQEGYFLKFHDTDSRTCTPELGQSPVILTLLQVAAPPQIVCGRSALRNWSAPSSRYGTPASSTRPAATPRCSPPSSTSQTPQSTWCVDQ